jgi:hypothetical protein
LVCSSKLRNSSQKRTQPRQSCSVSWYHQTACEAGTKLQVIHTIECSTTTMKAATPPCRLQHHHEGCNTTMKARQFSTVADAGMKAPHSTVSPPKEIQIHDTAFGASLPMYRPKKKWSTRGENVVVTKVL